MSTETAVNTDVSAKSPHCLVEKRDHVLIVTMNRPEARNALSGEMMEIMVEAWDRIDSDPDIRVAILTGAGGTFCAGMDLKEMNRNAPGDKFTGGMDVTRLPALLKGRRLTKPLHRSRRRPRHRGRHRNPAGHRHPRRRRERPIRRLRGRLGLFPLGGSAVRLVRQIPYTLAAEILLTGRTVPAPEAKELGLVGHVVPDGQALEKALEIAEQIAANGPIAVQAILKTIRVTEGMHEEEAFALEAQIGMAVFKSDDAKEGPRSFAEKRAPRFTGK